MEHTNAVEKRASEEPRVLEKVIRVLQSASELNYALTSTTRLSALASASSSLSNSIPEAKAELLANRGRFSEEQFEGLMQILERTEQGEIQNPLRDVMRSFARAADAPPGDPWGDIQTARKKGFEVSKSFTTAIPYHIGRILKEAGFETKSFELSAQTKQE